MTSTPARRAARLQLGPRDGFQGAVPNLTEDSAVGPDADAIGVDVAYHGTVDVGSTRGETSCHDPAGADRDIARLDRPVDGPQDPHVAGRFDLAADLEVNAQQRNHHIHPSGFDHARKGILRQSG